MNFSMVTKVHGDARRIMQKEERRIFKSMLTSLKVELFRLRKAAAANLRKNELDLAPLVVLQRKNGKKARKRKAKAPLKNFWRGIVYKLETKTLTGWVGFIGTKKGAAWQAEAVERFSEKTKITYTKKVRDKLHEMGIHISENTKSATVPKRDIIGQMAVISAKDSVANIRKNFFKKMAGQRI